MFIFLASVNEIQTDSDRVEELMLLVKQGDKNAFSEVYGLVKASVYGFALSILKNAHDAEDVMHNCFVSIWENAPNYRAHGKPMAWILTITKNLCYMKLRELKKTTEIEPDNQKLTVAPDNTAATVEDKAILQLALSVLNDEERQIVMLHAVSGLKFREIAELLDMLTATVLSKYHRSIAKMKKLLEEKK